MENKMSDAARASLNAYTRAWRARNKEKVRETNRKYWERRAEREAQAKNAPNNETTM